MNILLCAKQVPDDAVEVSMGADGKPAIDKIDKVVNAFDTYALEMAARFKEAAGEGEITVLCVGPDDAKNGLKNCLAVGGDYAYLASDEAFEGSDMQGIASILKDAIRKIEADKGIAFDIVCTGKDGKDINIDCDSVISCAGYIPAPLAEKSGNVHLVGDCLAIGNLRSVVWRAYDVAMKI